MKENNEKDNNAVEMMKQQAALRALDCVRDGMILGLGTGSTMRHFVDALGQKVEAGLDVRCVATSKATQAQAKVLGIKLATLDAVQRLDLTIDGADEMDKTLRLIKGGGGALLREKIVAAASDRLIIIADESKLVDCLGAFALPVEVDKFAHATTARMIAATLAKTGHTATLQLRTYENKDGQPAPFTSDGGNYIYDCALGQINNGEKLADDLSRVVGVVEHGLFIGYATGAILAGKDGLQELGDL